MSSRKHEVPNELLSEGVCGVEMEYMDGREDLRTTI